MTDTNDAAATSAGQGSYEPLSDRVRAGFAALYADVAAAASATQGAGEPLGHYDSAEFAADYWAAIDPSNARMNGIIGQHIVGQYRNLLSEAITRFLDAAERAGGADPFPVEITHNSPLLLSVLARGSWPLVCRVPSGVSLLVGNGRVVQRVTLTDGRRVDTVLYPGAAWSSPAVTREPTPQS